MKKTSRVHGSSGKARRALSVSVILKQFINSFLMVIDILQIHNQTTKVMIPMDLQLLQSSASFADLLDNASAFFQVQLQFMFV